MKARKIFLYIDVVVQAVLIAAILISVVIFSLGIGNYNDMAGYGIFATLFLGIWQVSSGFILAIITSDKWRIKYLLTVIAWFIIIFATVTINMQNILPKYLLYPIGWILYSMPAVLAFAYFRHTYLHLLKITSLPVSFWKLK